MDLFPQLFSDRLRLTKVIKEDIPTIVSYANNKNISLGTLNMPHPYTQYNATVWINMQSEGFKSQSQYIFGVYLKDLNRFIGGASLRLDAQHNKAELGYWIAEPFWNNGYASEATKRLLQFGFEDLGLNKIFATHFVSNPASGRVMEKTGMKIEGELIAHYFKNGTYQDVRQYYLLKNDFEVYRKN